MDHTHETTPVEFPGGRVEVQKEPMTGAETVKKAVDTRVRDTRFVLDQLAVLRAGRNPDAEGRRLPRGLGGVLDLDRIGMYGHSAGGITAAETMRADRRIDAGINMDGALQYSSTAFLPVALEGLDRPFMLMGKALLRSALRRMSVAASAMVRHRAAAGVRPRPVAQARNIPIPQFSVRPAATANTVRYCGIALHPPLPGR
ncbi:hypothetical protein [Streptomyces sp. NPDC059894]|uniref:hypothetical protein n=1 Tax=unclassified Streptomyces TaxID=2593676 RepID=UPI00365A0A98